MKKERKGFTSDMLNAAEREKVVLFKGIQKVYGFRAY